jgi:general secretion pathway protein D
MTPPTSPTTTSSETTPEEGGLIRGSVKVIADDRTGMLIIITRSENMRFFEQIVTALDVATAPDVSIKVIRLEYADAEDVASMLNALIGAASTTTRSSSSPKSSSSSSSSSKSSDYKPGDSRSTDSKPAAAEPARSSQLDEFIAQQRQLASASGKGGETKSKIGQLSAENVKILSDKRTNAIIIMASKGDMASIMDILKDMDIMLSQVLIEAVILQVSLDKTLERGVDWVQRSMIAYDKAGGNRNPLFSFAGGGGGGTLTPRDATALASTFSAGGGLTYYFTHFGLNMDAVIKLTQTDSRGKVLSSPVILTTDNKEAKIDISEERYFYKGVRYVGYSGTEQQSVPDVDIRKIGLTLTVTPRINANKFVSMEIAQKIENVAGEQAIEGQGNWPIVASREMNASVSVRSGETIVLGGLVERNEHNSGTRIPLLGSIPILGIPFRSTTDKNVRREIVVFITPSVLDTPEEIEAESIRRKDATSIGSEGMWEKGWSNSKMAEPRRGRIGQWWRSLLK